MFSTEISADALKQIKIAALIASDLSVGLHPDEDLLKQVNREMIAQILDDIKRLQP